MHIFKKSFFKSLVLFAALFFSSLAIAESFVVQSIQIEGLQRVTKETVLNYLPVRQGQTFNTEQSSSLINRLYDTGFFTDVRVGRRGGVLIIDLTERPTIGQIKVVGNSSIPKEAMDDILQRFGLVEGQVFNQATLDQVVQGLQTEYYNVGKFNVRITSDVESEVRNRVFIQINISEGRTVKVRGINIIGNEAFSEKKLLSELPLTTPGIFTFFNKKDQYTQDKLDASIQALERFYRDHGYVRVEVDSAQVELTPDKNEVYITFKVTEGGRYTISGYRLIGNLIVPKEEMEALIPLKSGELYSQEKVEDAYATIRNELGNQGYILTEVNAQPEINEETHEVFLTFHVNPNQQVYVRRIQFSGNLRTADNVLRRELRQPEAGLASLKNMNESSRQMLLLDYIRNVNINTQTVPGRPDQVDLTYDVTEAPSAAATAGLGYGTNGFVINASLQQSNFMGSGRSVGFGFTTNNIRQSYSFNYYNPYYTQSGIGRGFSLYYQRIRPGRQNVIDYTVSGFGADMNYNIPISDNSSWQVGAGYDNTKLTFGSDPTQEIKNFVEKVTGKTTKDVNSLTFDIFNAFLGWRYVGLDRVIFPTKGFVHNASAQVFGAPSKSGQTALSFYKLRYSSQWYQPLISDFILNLRGAVGYGAGIGSTDKLPFFQNYYGGGIGSSVPLRGYATNSLGPKDQRNRSLGGNFAASASANLILPSWFAANSLRTALFVDAGNVYDLKSEDSGQTSSGPIRFASGVSVEWRSPIGPLVFSFATPLNQKKNDKTEVFQFTISTGF